MSAERTYAARLLPCAAAALAAAVTLSAQERVDGLRTVPVEWRNAGPGGGGWIQSMTASRHVPGRLWVGCDVGGIYRSDDWGGTYASMNAGLRNMYIEDIAESPSRPDVLFAASPGGLFKTTDGGKSWREIRNGLPPAKASGYGAPFSKVVFDETRKGRVYAAIGDPRGHTHGKAAFGAIYKSEDDGETWTRIDLPDKVDVFDISPDPRTGAILASTSKGVYLDGKPSNAGLPPHLRTRRLARARSNPGVVYVTLRHASGEKPWAAGVYRSSDGGRTWENRSGGLDSSELGKPGESDDFTCWYDRIAVHPERADEVYAGGGTWRCEGVWKTTDGGRNWKCTFGKKDVKEPWLVKWGPDVRALAMSPFKPHALAFGSAGYVYASHDLGASWRQRYTAGNGDGTFSTRGLETTCLHSIDPDPDVKGRFYLSYFDIGLWRTDDGGKSFRRIMKGMDIGDCTSVAFARDGSKRIFAAFGVWCSDSKGWVAESSDGGETWRKLDGEGWRPAFSSHLCRIGGELVALARKRGIVRFSGGKWSDVAFPGGDANLLRADGGILYAGTASGEIWRSADAGREWERVAALPSGRIMGLFAKGDTLLAGARESHGGPGRARKEGGAWLSGDGGKNWRKIYSDRFVESVLVSGGWIVLAPRDYPFHDHSCGGGLVASQDGGKTWATLNSPSLWNWNCKTLCADPFDARSIWNGTHGNSVFVARLPEAETRRSAKASVLAEFVARDGTAAVRRLEGAPGPDGSTVFTVPKEEIAKWKCVSLFVEGSEARTGEDGWTLADRGLVTHFTKRDCLWAPERHWMANHYVAAKTPRFSFIGIVDSLQYEFDAVCEAKNGVYRTFPRWYVDEIGEPPYEDVSYCVYPLPAGSGYLEMAKTYRRHFDRKCLDLKPFRERAASRPSLEKLRKSFAVRRICAKKCLGTPPVNRDFTQENEPPVRVASRFADTLEDLRALKAAGMDDVAVCLAGWQTGGYDGRCPAAFPVCEEAGGEKELKRLIAETQKLGFIIDAHHNYTDSYTCSPLWDGGDVACRKDATSLYENKDFWDGGKPYDLCLERACRTYLYRDLEKARALGFSGCAYIDVFSAAWPYRCHSPGHPATRKDMERLQIQIAKFCRRLNGGFASECCFDHMLPYVDYINYAQCYIRKMRTWKNPGWDAVVPFFELAFHDVVLSNPDKVTQEIPRGADRLLLWEFGGRPIVYEWKRGDIPEMKKLYDEFLALRHLQGAEMTGHSILPGGVRRVSYAPGDVMYFNYGEKEAVADGVRIPPGNFRLAHSSARPERERRTVP